MSVAITNVTYVDGRDIESLSTDAIIEKIREAEKDIASYDTIKSKSTAIAKQVGEKTASLAGLVSLLDARDAANTAKTAAPVVADSEK